MPKRVSEDLANKRREIVSALRRRGMTLDEIYAQMSDAVVVVKENGTEKLLDNPVYMVNPKTNEPFDRSTISRDLDYLRKLANKRAAQGADEFRAEILDRFEELYRIAMKQKRYGEAREILSRMAKLTGANKPEKVEHSVDEKQLGKIDTLKELFQTMRQQELHNGNRETD